MKQNAGKEKKRKRIPDDSSNGDSTNIDDNLTLVEIINDDNHLEKYEGDRTL